LLSGGEEKRRINLIHRRFPASFAEGLLRSNGADYVVHSFQELRRLLERVLNLDGKIGD
jgi:hypothetical protein